MNSNIELQDRLKKLRQRVMHHMMYYGNGPEFAYWDKHWHKLYFMGQALKQNENMVHGTK